MVRDSCRGPLACGASSSPVQPARPFASHFPFQDLFLPFPNPWMQQRLGSHLCTCFPSRVPASRMDENIASLHRQVQRGNPSRLRSILDSLPTFLSIPLWLEPEGDRTERGSFPFTPFHSQPTRVRLGDPSLPWWWDDSGSGMDPVPTEAFPPFKGHRRPVPPMGQPHRMHPHTFTLRACAATDARGATIARRWRSETGTGIEAEGVEGSPGRVEGDTNDAVAWERGERPRPRTCRRRPGRV